MNTDDQLHSIVLGTVHDIEAAVRGDLYKVNSDTVVIDDIDEWAKEQYKREADEFREKHKGEFDHELYDSFDEFMEDEIGTVDDIDLPEEVGLYDYLSDNALGDERFEVDSSLDLCGGQMLVACGGPTVWIHDDRVCGYWGSSSQEICLDDDARRAMWDYFEERWNVLLDSRG